MAQVYGEGCVPKRRKQRACAVNPGIRCCRKVVELRPSLCATLVSLIGSLAQPRGVGARAFIFLPGVSPDFGSDCGATDVRFHLCPDAATLQAQSVDASGHVGLLLADATT